LIHRFAPFPGCAAPVGCDVAQRQPHQLGRRIVAWKVPTGLDDLAQLAVQALDGVGWIDQRSATIDAALKSIDALIVDCTYTQAEYPQKTGWGHGTFDSALALAKRVGARHLYCTHHLPTRSDDELEAVFAAFLEENDGQIQGLAITLAYEGLEVTL